MNIIPRKSTYILGCEAKDLYAAKRYASSVIDEKGDTQGYTHTNLKAYKNTLDFSIDLTKLKEIDYSVYRNRKSFFYDKELEKEFTYRVICVNFNLAYKHFNRYGDIYIRDGYSMNDVKEVGEYGDMTFYKDGICIAVKIGDVPDDVNVNWDNIPEYFDYDIVQRKISISKTIPTLLSVNELRNDLYKNGFRCNGIDYVRYKRSSGSSRVGKCLFIDKKLYNKMHKWDLCGLDIKEDDDIDLAGFESYISLPSSSCIDTMEIHPENILVIDDYESRFEDDVIAVYGEGENFIAKDERVKISNSIFDGQSLMDESLFSQKYGDRSMLLLRNRFFKSACFKTKIQQWFKDNNITDISQLNGYTIAKSIEDIKLITTPSSIKYIKFGTLEQWLENLYTTFGIVKYEKPTHYLDGLMVQCHYQLLNTLQLSKSEIEELVKPNIDYLRNIRNDGAVMRYHLKYPYNIADNNEAVYNKDEIIMKVMGMSSKFVDTKLYDGFKRDLTKSIIKNYKSGHIWVSGNYETLLGNGIEMLQHSIGIFNEESVLGIGNIFTKRFEFGKKLLVVRSPHINSGNLLLTNNTYNELIDKYFDLSKEVVYVNAIGENIQQRLNGCDYDSDSVLITDNEILVKSAEKNYNRFKVPTCFVEAKKIKSKYTSKDKCTLDINTSVNKIGEIVNMSQYLNSIMWDKIYKDIHNGIDEDTAFNNQKGLYRDICILAVASGVEIDKAKRVFEVNITKTLKMLKNKYAVYTEIDGEKKYTKPLFFKNITTGNGYKINPNQHYAEFNTSMDYLQKILNKVNFRLHREKKKELIPFSSIFDLKKIKPYAARKFHRTYVKNIINDIKNLDSRIRSLYIDYDKSTREEKANIAIEAERLRQQYTQILSYKILNNPLYVAEMIEEIDKLENKRYNRIIFNTLFATGNPNLYKAIKLSSDDIYELSRENNQENYDTVDLFGYTYYKQKRNSFAKI